MKLSLTLLFASTLSLSCWLWLANAQGADSKTALNPPEACPAGFAGHTLFMAGDSTMADKPLVPANAERGWGQLLPIYFKQALRVENHAANGRSSKSFRAEGRWKVLAERIKPGDFVIIQFGHNDEKADGARHTDPYGSFTDNLRAYVTEVRQHKGHPILATPIARRAFDKEGAPRDTHGDFAEAIRKLALTEKIPLLELAHKSEELLRFLGPERSKKLYNHLDKDESPAHPEPQQDNTHLNALGATRICDLAIAEILAKVPELGGYVKGR